MVRNPMGLSSLRAEVQAPMGHASVERRIAPIGGQMKRKPKLKPIEARTFGQICSLPRDGYDTKNFWILIDNGIVICQQQNGKPSTNTMKIPRAEFDRMARWYVTGKAGK